MGGVILKTALNTMKQTAVRNVEFYGDRIETNARKRIVEQGKDGALDVKLGNYSAPPEKRTETTHQSNAPEADES